MPKFASNLTMMFNEVDFLDRFREATNAGFNAVEFLSPYEHPKEQVAERLRINGLVTALFNFPVGDWDAGERGIACLPDRVGEFQDSVGTAIEYAKALGCKQMNCLSGIAPAGVDVEKVHEIFVSNLRFAAENLDEVGVRLLIEPINTRDIPGMYLTHTDQALSIIDEVGSDNMGLQYDVYHMQIMEGDLTPTMEANKDRISHIQIADNPGRNEPGTGEINYPFVFKAIDEMGYDGWVGCEYKPLTTTKEGLGWIRDYISR